MLILALLDKNKWCLAILKINEQCWEMLRNAEHTKKPQNMQKTLGCSVLCIGLFQQDCLEWYCLLKSNIKHMFVSKYLRSFIEGSDSIKISTVLNLVRFLISTDYWIVSFPNLAWFFSTTNSFLIKGLIYCNLCWPSGIMLEVLASLFNFSNRVCYCWSYMSAWTKFNQVYQLLRFWIVWLLFALKS